MLDKLRTVLDDPYTQQPWRKKQDVWPLVKQLQTDRKLMSLCKKQGVVIPTPQQMATELAIMATQRPPLGHHNQNVLLSGGFFWKPVMTREGVDMPSHTGFVSRLCLNVSIGILPLALMAFLCPFSSNLQTFCSGHVSNFQERLTVNSLLSQWLLARLNPIPKA